MFTTVHIHNRPSSQQVTYTTGHVHNTPRSQQSTFTTDLFTTGHINIDTFLTDHT